MGVGVNIAVVAAIFLGILSSGLAQGSTTWPSDTPFLEYPDRVEINITLNSEMGVVILMDEEITLDIYVAKLNYYGTGIPSIGTFNFGTRALLNPEMRRNSTLDPADPDAWYLVITERQDYENPDQRLYVFFVLVTADETTTSSVPISLNIMNIDDNAPIVNIDSGCVVPELFVGLTNCTYEVTDVDGAISINAMTFRIEGSRNEDELFDVDEERYTNDQYRMSITLRTLQPLDFVESALHVLSLTAMDSLPNNHTVSVIVQVENIEHRPPSWVQIWATQQFDEKTEQNFTVRAIDGDTGINKAIKYKLYKNETYTFFDIDEDSGVLTVQPIDRDALEQEIFQFEISAYKYDNETWETPFAVVIIVNDVNDNWPVPIEETYNITIAEETFMSLAFEQEFGFHDIDLGINAQYTVALESVFPASAASAFTLSPADGYQRQTFFMTVVNASMLDFELVDFQNIELTLVAQELVNPDHVGRATLYISLQNWNDELPIFEHDYYEVEFEETVGAGFFVETVLAHDRDIGDVVVHSILGTASDFLSINESTGDITVSVDNAFNYLRQSEIIVQVRAEDTLMEPFHSATVQLTIRLIDVNNNDPEITMPRIAPSVEENVPQGYNITEGISGSDPDTSADIYFQIDWDSTYATKQGRLTSPEEYVECVEIETVYPDPTQRGNAIGRILVREIRDNVTIDYEMFEVLYLTVRVIDRNTVIGEGYAEDEGYAEAILVIAIEDMNDNPPVWSTGTLQQVRVVRELAQEGVVIGTVFATDIDGPMYNQITYIIEPREDTQADFVRIDEITGQMEVWEGSGINADIPPTYFLYYTVVATDCCIREGQECGPDPMCHNTTGEIEISITDTNNQSPIALETLLPDIWIDEKSPTGFNITLIEAVDADRDEIYNTIHYSINYREHPSLRLFFDVDPDTGRLYVYYTTDQVLDRDFGDDTHQVHLILTDNYLQEGDRNMNTGATTVTIRLRDINDQSPEMPLPSILTWSVTENLQMDEAILPEIHAIDHDEPNTDNSRVNYNILDISLTDRILNLPEDLFRILNINNETGRLYTNHDLRGYWGVYNIHILAYDQGIPQQSSNETYELIVRPYNFHNPQFTFPNEGQVIRIARERTTVGGVLILPDNSFLSSISATDEDGREAGVVTFQVVGDENALEYIEISNDGENVGTLLLNRELQDLDTFTVTIRATDGGTEPGALSSDVTITLRFVATQGDPVFVTTTASVAFTELEGGLDESQQLPQADDPKNVDCSGDDCHAVYYYITGGEDSNLFTLNSSSNILRLSSALNRSEALTRDVVISASNSATAAGVVVTELNRLFVTVNVLEANPMPRFEYSIYTAGITITDNINKILVTVHATHSENDIITYNIEWDSMTTHSSLESVRLSAFTLDSTSGELILNFQPQSSMSGMFEFDVVATDSLNRTDTTEVKIYLISDENRVSFRFYNTLTQVEPEVNFIADTFSYGFGLTCNIDYVVPASDDSGAALDDLTDVRAHFIENDLVVDTATIEMKRSDITLMRVLHEGLLTRSLLLQDLVTTSSSTSSGVDLVLQSVLVTVILVLGIMCFILLGAYFIKTRSLNRRLEALSTTKFGSQDSGLNRAGAVVPGTNKHAVEGSNPIWNEQINAPDFDAISETSGDSDLIGIEDDPHFSYDYFPPENVTSVPYRQMDNPSETEKKEDNNTTTAADHMNGFNFNHASPFNRLNSAGHESRY